MLCHNSAIQTKKGTNDAQRSADASSLQSVHQAVLSRIKERHNSLNERVEAWEQYRSSLGKFLSWLDNSERDRKRLKLRRLQEHSLPVSLHRVELLLDKLGQGIVIREEAERAAQQLLDKLGVEESSFTVRADMKSAVDRLTDLEAGLSSWRDFLCRVSRLYDNLESGIKAIRGQLQSVQSDLVSDAEIPTDLQSAANLLQTYRVSLLSSNWISGGLLTNEHCMYL